MKIKIREIKDLAEAPKDDIEKDVKAATYSDAELKKQAAAKKLAARKAAAEKKSIKAKTDLLARNKVKADRKAAADTKAARLPAFFTIFDEGNQLNVEVSVLHPVKSVPVKIPKLQQKITKVGDKKSLGKSLSGSTLKALANDLQALAKIINKPGEVFKYAPLKNDQQIIKWAAKAGQKNAKKGLKEILGGDVVADERAAAEAAATLLALQQKNREADDKRFDAMVNKVRKRIQNVVPKKAKLKPDLKAHMKSMHKKLKAMSLQQLLKQADQQAARLERAAAAVDKTEVGNLVKNANADVIFLRYVNKKMNVDIRERLKEKGVEVQTMQQALIKISNKADKESGAGTGADEAGGFAGSSPDKIKSLLRMPQINSGKAGSGRFKDLDPKDKIRFSKFLDSVFDPCGEPRSFFDSLKDGGCKFAHAMARELINDLDKGIGSGPDGSDALSQLEKSHFARLEKNHKNYKKEPETAQAGMDSGMVAEVVPSADKHSSVTRGKEGAVRTFDETMPADHWAVRQGICEPGESVKSCMAKAGKGR
tara:strand:+ start:2699 stop:4312 length:1614 start_codon:yes stop_codon:yes gene_type:complete